MKTNTYTVYIRTGDHNLAGTDSNIYLQLFGTTGKTDEILLPPKDVFSFEAGSTDKYILEVPDVGNLTRCCLRQDNTEAGPSSGWQIKDVRIEDDETARVWTFSFDCWLGLEESGKLSACVNA